jgi:hypothetical protein
MITLIGPLNLPAPRHGVYRESDWAALHEKIAEMNRMIHKYPPGRRPPQPKFTARGEYRGARRIDTRAVYAGRAIRATLDGAERDKVQTARDRIGAALAETTLSAADRANLEEARDRLDEALGPTAASAPGQTGAQVGGRRPLELERGRAVAVRPRSIADIARAHYAQPERRLTR